MQRVTYAPKNSSGPMQVFGLGVIQPGPVYVTDEQATALADNPDFVVDAPAAPAPDIAADETALAEAAAAERVAAARLAAATAASTASPPPGDNPTQEG